MDKESNRDKVYKALEEEVKRDKARTNVLKISELGLVEMTRKRVQEDLTRFITEPCPVCQGNGHVRSRETICFEIFREVQREAGRSPKKENIYVNVSPAVADMLYTDEMDSLEQVERELGKRLIVRALAHFHQEHYEVYAR